ncbi:Hypothetical predicted protein, partial [Mytilus galloprovincialis]
MRFFTTIKDPLNGQRHQNNGGPFRPSQTFTHTATTCCFFASPDQRRHIYIATNPGPIKFPCGSCKKPTQLTAGSVVYAPFLISPTHFFEIQHENENRNFSIDNDDEFDRSYLPSDQTTTTGVNISTREDEINLFEELKQVRNKHPNKFICSYLNINSLRYKFCAIKDLLSERIVDLLIIAETKLDDTFPDAQFKLDHYHLWRADRSAHGGGLAAYMRSDLASDRQKHLEFKTIESLCVEV